LARNLNYGLPSGELFTGYAPRGRGPKYYDLKISSQRLPFRVKEVRQ